MLSLLFKLFNLLFSPYLMPFMVLSLINVSGQLTLQLQLAIKSLILHALDWVCPPISLLHRISPLCLPIPSAFSQPQYHRYHHPSRLHHKSQNRHQGWFHSLKHSTSFLEAQLSQDPCQLQILQILEKSVYNSQVQMREASGKKLIKTKRKISEVEEKEKYIDDLAFRYELHLKQEEKLSNLKNSEVSCWAFLNTIQKSFSSIWNRFCSVSIRGPFNDKQLFISICRKQKLFWTAKQQEELSNFSSVISETQNFENNFFDTNQIICIFFTKQSIQEILTMLEGPFIKQLIQKAKTSAWKVVLKYLDEAKDSIWQERIRQFLDVQQQLEANKLLEITARSLNATQRLLKLKQNSSSAQKQVSQEMSKQGMKFPQVAPLWRGIFDQIIMFKPKGLLYASLDEINDVFFQRKILQEQVRAKVQLILVQKARKLNQNKEFQMDSVHKIEISQIKDQY